VAAPPDPVADAWNQYLEALRNAADYEIVEVWAWDRLVATLRDLNTPPKKRRRRVV
jgi:hypothetical protein